MSFDKDTRNSLSKMVSACRRLLTEDATDQLRGRFGMHPDGTILPVERLDLVEHEHADAEALRELLIHFAAGEAGHEEDRQGRAYERLVLEISFTTLNRLAALRLCEDRGLVVECVRQGTASDGFRLFERVADGALGTRYQTYRVFLEGLFDELALDLGILFDRTTPQSAVFPSERCLDDVLVELNRPELTHLWAADETIGWIYQYFNPPEERDAMRKASPKAPRTSRELAVRNQFFTPRYIVEFLTDNTLGRIWYEMRKGDTVLKDECRYLVRRPNETFLGPGKEAPPSDESDGDLSQEELLKRPVHIAHRPMKDPRDLRVIDPACGSGHFLLYTFDLLQHIYEEAWQETENSKFDIEGPTLREDFETIEDLRRAAPRLIIEHNLYGIDIDPRAAQIAALALWLRAQKDWKRHGLKAADRPRIERSNIVTAEPMPGEADMRREFSAELRPRVLGQLVDAVFETMKLAGEAGSLLRIEEEIKETIAAAKRQWLEGPKREQKVLFPELLTNKPQQQMLFDLKDVTDEQFWEQTEDLILAALKSYAEQAENEHTVRRRLFAEDAAQGFAFIDLCRERYDVALMNPPFGGFSKQWTAQAKVNYLHSSNDILAAFVERFLSLLNAGGRLGAITSRTCFFLSSFKDWRLNVVLKHSAIRSIADLGQGVMDSAMVEAAAYVLERTSPTPGTTVFRAIADSDRQSALEACIDAHQQARTEDRLFLADQATFHLLPDSPFVYWIDGETIRQFQTGTTFEPDVGDVRQGLATGDDPRYVRTVWEVQHEDTIFCYYPTKGEGSCRFDDPIVQAYFRRRNKGTPRWAFHVKAGASQPWYSPVTLKINWAQDGEELRNFKTKSGKLRSRPQNLRFYYRPGFSWTRRAVRLYPYAIPGNCIPSVSRYMAFPDHDLQSEAIGVCASRVVSAFLRFYGEKFEFPNFLVDTLKILPWPELPAEAKTHFESLVSREVEQRRLAYQNHEPFHEFLLPVKIQDFSTTGQALAFDPGALLDDGTERIVAKAFGFTEEQARLVERDLVEAIAYQRGDTPTADEETAAEAGQLPNGEAEEESEGDDNSDFVLDYSPQTIEETHISYLVGVALGRWDVRIAIDSSLAPKLPDPFSPLPVCPPGMLIGPHGLPAEPNRIVSAEWLRARPDAGTLPQDGSINCETIPDQEYPLRISWDGILVDDPGFSGAQPHRDDLVRRVREVLDLIWKDKANAVEQVACEHLGVKDLRVYFRKSAGFFQDHLNRYSKSRRKAPIYWPLSTVSGSYTIWLFYHRLTDQTLYATVNKYLEPKISDVEHAAARIESRIETVSGHEATQLRDHLNEARSFVGELRELREELLRIAALPYKPNLNDGVLINAAPFHKLFRLRSWAKATEQVWKKLEGGDYDWAHLAFAIWPEQVRQTCRMDRSVAIAHGLDDLCEVEPTVVKARGRRTRRNKNKVTQ